MDFARDFFAFPLIVALAGCSAIVSPGGSALQDPTAIDAAADGGGLDGAPPADAGMDTGVAVDSGMDSGAPVDSGTDSGTPVDSGMDSGTTCPASCALGCPPGLTRCYEVIPSNVPATLFDPAASDLNALGDTDLFFDTGSCSATTVDSHIVSADSGEEFCVLVAGNVRVDPAATLTIRGARPVIILASGDVTIQGTLDASATLDEPGPGGYLGGVGDPPAGRGPSGGEAGEHYRSMMPFGDSFEDGGGGGGALCGAGGDGGDGGRARGGRGGASIPSGWDLQPLGGGSGGGRGRGSFAGSSTNAGFGGAGGGAVQITARGSIVVEGAILVGGGGGLSGENRITGNWGSGGGGGSGGALLLEAPLVNVTGALLDGAGGGGGAIGDTAGAGEDGMDGRDTLDRAAGGAPIGSRGAGGMGGGADVLDGEPGESLTDSPVNGGGGGGGAGCILVRNGDGALPVVGIVTPSAAPAYRALPIMRR